jgi:hypothetical protein
MRKVEFGGNNVINVEGKGLCLFNGDFKDEWEWVVLKV